MDIILRGASSSEPLKLSGTIPFVSTIPINFRVESHGDALNFLDGLTGELVALQSGNSDLRLLVTGKYNKPMVNGFLKSGRYNSNQITISDRNHDKNQYILISKSY